MVIKCGCSAEAKYLVYEHEEPHCMECMLDAVECKNQVLVRVIDDAYANSLQRKQ
ncbi:hypothetical protein ACFQ5D_18115 [Paenibacillus farraposensis]|uniref:Inhibitor of sigma-G Gin n=1 Tax=Paenibacillus farraposensis TaxID=2807095 RepID=A0ABW4DHV0_9BACL|nr:hypothetical protein [Paenibacillus farraposensis]MCC3381946.1 hypothetical protein [Paenibacillus farraposensis]